MNLTFTKFAFITSVSVITSAWVNSMIGENCTIPLPPIMPCSVWNFLIIALFIGILLDLIIEIILPRVFYFKRKDVKIKVGEYHNLGFLQSTKVGVRIDNDSDYDIYPSVKILGKIKRTEYFNDRTEKTANIPPVKGNKIIWLKSQKIESENSREMVFAEVEKKKNVSLLVEPLHDSLKSYYGVIDKNNEANHVKWEFNFQLFGKMKGLKFKENIYFISIESQLMNNEVCLMISEPEKIAS